MIKKNMKKVDEDSTDESNLIINLGCEFIIENNRSEILQFPYAYAYGNNVFVSFDQHEDAILLNPVDGMKISRNNGATWGEYQQNENFKMASMLKLANGELLGICAYTYKIDARHSLTHFWKSADDGATWSHHTGTITYQKDAGDTARFMSGLIQNTDGSFMMPAYIMWQEDLETSNRCAVLWLKSANGIDWTSTEIAHSDTVGVEEDGFCEPTVVRCADNSLLIVMRTGNLYSMYQMRSTDEGMTWSAPIKLPGTAGLNVSGDDYVWGKQPIMTLLPNGVLVLGAGQDGCRLLFSQSGCGYHWSDYTTAFELSQPDGMCGDTIGIAQVSSAPNRLILISDNGATRYFGAPTNPAIRGRFMDVASTK